MILEYLFGLFLTITVLLTSILCIRLYLKASYNKIDSMYWGLSFFVFFIYLLLVFLFNVAYERLSTAGVLQAHINGLQYLELYAIFLMLAVAVRLRQAILNHSELQIRVCRLGVEVFKIILLLFFIILVSQELTPNQYDYRGHSRLMLLATCELTLLFQSWKSLLLLLTFFLLPSLGFYLLIKLGVGFLALSEMTQIINIQHSMYFDPTLLMLESLFALIGVVLGLVGVLGVQYSIKITSFLNYTGPERRKKPNDTQD